MPRNRIYSTSSDEDSETDSRLSHQSQNKSTALKMNPLVKEVTKQRSSIICNFCHKSKIDSLMWGPMYQLEDITVHYFCMLFSAGLSQNGEDWDGILGFLPRDIHKELNRGKKLICKYCKGRRATVGCSIQKCKVSFHYPCGLEQGSLFKFIDNFESYCVSHRENIVIPVEKECWQCPVCFEDFDDEKYPIKPPCCGNNKNNGVFHRRCMMEAARTSGLHFFKCPLCNDKDTFSKAMRNMGIYVPDRDAAWELEPGAFQELNQQYNRCDRQPCLCPNGRKFNSTTKERYHDWKLVRCGGCGAAGVHMKCGGLENLTYRCETCRAVLSGTACLGDSDEEEFTRRRQSGFTRNRLNNLNRISRRRYESGTGSSSSDEEDDDLRLNVLDTITIKESEEEDDDDVLSVHSSTTSSDSKTERVTSDAFGRTYKILGLDDEDEDKGSIVDDDFEDEEDDDLILTSYSDENVREKELPKSTRKWISRRRYYDNNNKASSPLTPSSSLNSLNSTFSSCSTTDITRPKYFSIFTNNYNTSGNFKERLDKLKECYEQIPVAENSLSSDGNLTKQSSTNNDISKVRSGLVKNKGNSPSVMNLISESRRPRAGPSSRRNCDYPGIPESAFSKHGNFEISNVIASIEELFQKKVKEKESESSSATVTTPEEKKKLSKVAFIRTTTDNTSMDDSDDDIMILSPRSSCSSSTLIQTKSPFRHKKPATATKLPKDLQYLDDTSANIIESVLRKFRASVNFHPAIENTAENQPIISILPPSPQKSRENNENETSASAELAIPTTALSPQKSPAKPSKPYVSSERLISRRSPSPQKSPAKPYISSERLISRRSPSPQVLPEMLISTRTSSPQKLPPLTSEVSSELVISSVSTTSPSSPQKSPAKQCASSEIVIPTASPSSSSPQILSSAEELSSELVILTSPFSPSPQKSPSKLDVTSELVFPTTYPSPQNTQKSPSKLDVTSELVFPTKYPSNPSPQKSLSKQEVVLPFPKISPSPQKLSPIANQEVSAELFIPTRSPSPQKSSAIANKEVIPTTSPLSQKSPANEEVSPELIIPTTPSSPQKSPASTFQEIAEVIVIKKEKSPIQCYSLSEEEDFNCVDVEDDDDCVIDKVVQCIKKEDMDIEEVVVVKEEKPMQTTAAFQAIIDRMKTRNSKPAVINGKSTAGLSNALINSMARRNPITVNDNNIPSSSRDLFKNNNHTKNENVSKTIPSNDNNSGSGPTEIVISSSEDEQRAGPSTSPSKKPSTTIRRERALMPNRNRHFIPLPHNKRLRERPSDDKEYSSDNSVDSSSRKSRKRPRF